MTRWMSVFGAEFRVLARYVVRSRMRWVWLAAGFMWPASFIWLFGSAGSAPIRLASDLAVIPVGPILYGLLGAQLADMVHARRAQEVLSAWPRHEVARSGALLAVIAGVAGLSALVVNGLLAVQAAYPFWQSVRWAAYSFWAGSLEIGLVAALWLSLGFLVGQYVRGLWKPLGMIVVPAALLIGAIGYVASGTGRGGLHPLATVIGGFEVAPLAWLNPYVSSVWGFGPYDGAFWWLAGLTAGLVVLLVVIACLRAYGRRAAMVAGTIVVAASVGVLAVGAVGTVVGLNARNTYVPLAASFRRMPTAPVRILSATATVDVRRANDLRASIVYRLMPTRSADALQLFLNPALRIAGLRVNGRSGVAIRFRPNGRITLNTSLRTGRILTVSIQWSGDPVLWAADGGVASPGPHTGAFAATFVGAEGWWLPGGTWYPVLKTVEPAPWHLRLQAPPQTVSATSLGVAVGGSSARLAGQANNLAILGGHLNGIHFHGVELLVGADEAPIWARALSGRGADPTPMSGGRVSLVLERLSPAPRGVLVLPAGSGTGPYMRTVDPVLPQFWAPGFVGAISSGNSALNATTNTAQGYGMMDSLDTQLLDQILNLWASGGQSSASPSNPVEEEMICAAEENLQGGANCGEITPLWNSIQALSPIEVAQVLTAARRAGLHHQLSDITAQSIVSHVQSGAGG